MRRNAIIMRCWEWRNPPAPMTLKRPTAKRPSSTTPDRNPGDKEAEAKFKECNEAYEVLSNDEKRSRYDQYGFAGVDPNFNPNAGFGGGFGGFGDAFSGFGDIFGDLFGGGSRRSPNGPRQGENVGARLELTFEEAASGAEKEVPVTRIEACAKCSGTGSAAGSAPEGTLPHLPGHRLGAHHPELYGYDHAVHHRLSQVRRHWQNH